jgi:hypothetical protein
MCSKLHAQCSPNRFQAGGLDALIAADYGHIEMDSSGRYHAIRHVRHFSPRHLAHGLDDGGGQNRFYENMFWVRQGLREFVVSRRRQAFFSIK